MKTVHIGSSRLSDSGRTLEYSVVVTGLLSEGLKPGGESYGVCVRMAEPSGECEIVRDITTKYGEIVAFVQKLCEFQVTPASLRDVVYDSLPL